jgi:hypothetical protein
MAPKGKKKDNGKGKKADAKATKKVERTPAARAEQAAASDDSLFTVLSGHAEHAGLKAVEGESEADFQTRILDAIATLPDDEWDKLPDETKVWSNDLEAARKDANKGKKEEKKADPKVKEKKEKAKKTAEEKKAGKKTDYSGEAWKEGSSAQIIYQKLVSLGEKGATPEDLASKIKNVESSNLEGRVKTVLRAAVLRGLAKKQDGKFIAV